MRKLALLAASLPAALMFGAASIALADPPLTGATPLATLETMVSNLGYTTTDSADKTSFSIQYQGKYNYSLQFIMSTNGQVAYVYTFLTTVPAAKIGKIPVLKMLEFNDATNVYFSSQSRTDGEHLLLNNTWGMQGLTPQSLRSDLQFFVAKLDQTDTLWNMTLWK